MAHRGDSDNRRNPRLFSDIDKKQSTDRTSQDGATARLALMPRMQEKYQDSADRASEAENWTDLKELVESPKFQQDDAPLFPPASHGLDRRTKPIRRPTPLNIGRPTSPESVPVASPSRARWEHLRQHVLPIPIRPATPPTPQPHTSPSGSTILPLPRTQTPKPSRLARLGFRQVVEHAREVAIDDNRKFAAELQRICWSTRFVEPQRFKPEREPATMGSSLHLPFMSNASLPATGMPSVDSLTHGSNKKNEIRRPPSVHSTELAYRSLPSLKPLYHALLHYATPSADGMFPLRSLPNESQVLSTLLGPFMTSERGTHIEEERWLAIESFEVITRTWAPSNEVAGIERYLWCTKACFIPPTGLRTRIISTFWGLMIPTDTNYVVTKPSTFKTIAQGLFCLLPTLRPISTSAADQEDVSLLNDIISKLHSGCCGEFDDDSLQMEYNANITSKDDTGLVRTAILLEALSRCLEECADDTRLWLLQNALEANWIIYPKGSRFTPLLAAVHACTLGNLSRALLSILTVPVDQSIYLSRAQHVARILQARIIPEIAIIGSSITSETKSNVVKIIIELICMDKAKEPTRWGVSVVCQWYRGSQDWKTSLEKTFQEIIFNRDWPSLLGKLFPLVKLLPDEVRKPFVTFILSLLHDKLVQEPPAHPCLPLTNFLDTLARHYPQIFFKVLFSCAASSKEFTVVNYLCIIVVVSRFLPDFWTRDAEMMAVALMSDPGGKTSTAEDRVWAKARLGQSVLLLEVVGRIQAVRREKEATQNTEASSFVETVKFAVALEARLGILLEAKEQTSLIPPSQRLLFCVLFREIRLLTRSLKPAMWLSRTVSWFIDLHLDDEINQDPEVEEKSSVGQLQGLYAAAQDGVKSSHQRRSTMLLSKTLVKAQQNDETSLEGTTDLSAMFAIRTKLVLSLTKGFISKVMKLFVAMSTLLTTNDYRRLGPYLWAQVAGEGDTSLTASVCFLIMQCAEKTPLDLQAIMEVDLQSSDDDNRLQAVRNIGILSNWRFQILSQHVVADRARRPFKLTRGPLPFVATDVGSSLYVQEDDANDLKDSLPSELRKRLAEIGWDQDDRPVDQQMERNKTPMSLLPTHQLDRLDNPAPDLQASSPSSPNVSAMASPPGEKEGGGLLRRNSSSGGPLHGVKRRAVFVPSLALIFPRLSTLVFDRNIEVTCAARDTVVDLMRNDPALLARPVLDLFAGEHKDVQSATSTITAFLHIQRTLPPPMSHHMFNSLAGFLKFASRIEENSEVLQDFASTTAILAKLVNQVSGMSIREIRRAKLEAFLIPSGSLWFPMSAPVGPMFPRGPQTASNPFDDMPPQLVSMTMIRVSQNMLFLSMLRRNRQDVQLIRKSMSRFMLPSINAVSGATSLELSDFVPHRSHPDETDSGMKALSLMLSRSHLLLVAQVFRSMSRHLSDRNELAILVDGLNRILLAHGDDIGIVGQAMIALMVASTRFRRLFTSGGGYALFMPTVIKIYTESESHSGIKLAIEYTVNRFYALHKEAFIFQTLDIMAHMAMLPNPESDWHAKSIFNLFSALRKGVLPMTPDAAGIHNSNKLQEREALIVNTAEEKPQTFMSLLRRGDSQNGDHITIDLPEEYETTRLGIDDLVRLFLTVIAHDPSIVRAEQFLRLFRSLTPYLYNSTSSARIVLQEGIDALGLVLIRASAKPKSMDTPSTHSSNQVSGQMPGETLLENQLLEKSRSASDVMSMRLDYLTLIVAFTRAGGHLPQPAAFRMLGLVGLMLRDAPIDVNNAISKLLHDFVRTSLVRESPPSIKMTVTLLQDLGTLISANAVATDFTGVFESITEVAANPQYANDASFSHVIVTQVCAPGLAACELAASERLLLSLPSRPSLVALLAQAVLLRGADVITEVEKRTPSYDFLAGVVLPLTMSLRTSSSLISDAARSDTWHRNTLARAWIRLLSYSITACQRVISRTLERTKSQDKRSTNSKRSVFPTFAIALQIIKTIVIRAGDDLSLHLPSVWPRISAFLKSVLADGSALFSSRAQDISPLPSPTPSPRGSAQFDHFPPSLSISTDIRSSPAQFSNPRVIDYTLWSFLELLCVHRNPLSLQMRIFIVEKVVELDTELRQQNSHSPMSSGGRPLSASVFSKARRRSGLPSPQSSPRLSPSQSFPYDTSFTSLEPMRQPGYSKLASPHDTRGPKIVHLGPISTSALTRALSPSRGKGADIMATTAKIKSLTLIRATYRRIRTVQTCMGYSTLLPMPHSNEMDADEVFTTAWTNKQALEAIIKESRELMEEFEESDRNLEDEGVMVDSYQPMA